MTNDQLMAEQVHDEHSDFSDSTQAEIIRYAQLDALLFAKSHSKVSMQEAERIANLHARMHYLRSGHENPVDLTDMLAAADYSSTFYFVRANLRRQRRTGERCPNVDDETTKLAQADTGMFPTCLPRW